ncbi:MAG: dinitrogenase iron-molybdenum cofactor biosynthesis protein [Desulfobacteraceae bacterium]|nr:dinitrogenase iron-molybdenum cofactor biosynthesis protein [Desulfobacteraceae bacterium]
MENGRIAIPSNGQGGLDGTRSGHFGHCDVFTLVDVEEGKIKDVAILQNQEHVQGGCMVPVNLLSENRVTALIVGGIGMRPLMGFKQAGIDVYHDDQHLEINCVVNDLIAGTLVEIRNDQVCGGAAGGQM